MARHTEKLSSMPGVEYEAATGILYIDLKTYLSSVPGHKDAWWRDLALLRIAAEWRLQMPNHAVREYRVKGVG